MHRIQRAADQLVHHAITELAILGLIVVSVVLLVVELAVPPGALHEAIAVAGNVLTSVFVVELLVRFWVARKKSRFFLRYWVDILAVLPVARPLRMFRVLRVLRLFRAGVLLNRRFTAFRLLFAGSAREILILAIGSAILVISAATVIFLAEGHVNGDFSSFDAAMWYSLLSLVGGEPIGGHPTSPLGMAMTLLLMVGGLTVFGMFVGTVSAGMMTRISTRTGLQELDLDELRDHVIVCGWNRSGPVVLGELFGPRTPDNRAVVVVGEVPSIGDEVYEVLGAKPENLYFHQGDWTRDEVLRAVGIEAASTAILLTDAIVPRSDQDRDARTVLAALTIERLNPRIYTIAEVTTRQNEPMLRRAGVEQIVVGHWYAGVIMGSASRNAAVMRILDAVLTAAHGNDFHTMGIPAVWVGRQVGELHGTLFSQHQALLLALRTSDGTLLVNPPANRTIAAGDTVVVIAHGPPPDWS